MNVRRFTARTSRDALVLVRQALGEDAVVLSTKPSVDGIEVLAMAPEGMKQVERMAATPAAAARAEPAPPRDEVAADVAQLSMSTLSFQDYVRERMLRRRQASMKPEAPTPARDEPRSAAPTPDRASVLEQRMTAPAAPLLREPPVLREPMAIAAASASAFAAEPHVPALADMQHAAQGGLASRRDQEDMMSELRSMKGLIEERFGALAFMEKLNRQPAQARLTQKLLDCGFSPALIRKIGDSLPMDVA
ncbi:MAG: flagellar biosynthesis protein FlhF, partial [Pseudomonadota bacterium]